MRARKMVRGKGSRASKTPSGSRLVMITGLSGSGKISALKVFEDMGYYCVDNLPAELIPTFAELILGVAATDERPPWWWTSAKAAA